jgi:ABC-type amino acid transport substrate-binding protein
MRIARRTALLALAAPPALAQPAPASLARAFAPEGKLRAVINLGNPILAGRASEAVPPHGVSVDLARELARRLGLELEMVVVNAAGRAVETMRAGRVDIGFFAVDPARSQGIEFSPPYIEIEGAYLVRDASPITRLEEVDRPGTRIVVGLNSAYDLFLTREIRQASLLRAPTSPAVVEEFLRQGADVAAGVRQQLEADQARFPGLRLLPGRFMVIHQAMGLAAGRDPAALAYLTAFVEEMKASGFVAAALARHGIQGASVAPAR